MKISPSDQLFLFATAGAASAAAIDFFVNGLASGVAKSAGVFAAAGLPGGVLTVAAWTAFGLVGPASAAYFRPLTRRSSFALAFGAAAVLAMLVPR